MEQWLKWSCEAGGLTRRRQVGAIPIPILHPTNLALFGHKITFYRFNQGGSYYYRGLKSEQGLSALVSLTLTNGMELQDVPKTAQSVALDKIRTIRRRMALFTSECSEKFTNAKFNATSLCV